MDFADCKPQCQGNMELMQLFVQMGMKQPLLHMVNQCQMHLHIFLLLDIVLGLGDYILPQFWGHFPQLNCTLSGPTWFNPPSRLGICENKHYPQHSTLAATNVQQFH